MVREVLDEWQRGNFWAVAPLLSPEVRASWSDPSGHTECQGPAEIASRFRDFIGHWEDFRVIAQAFEVLDTGHILVRARTHGIGKQSGLPLDAESFMVFAFAGDKIVGFHWFFDRDRALLAASLTS